MSSTASGTSSNNNNFWIVSKHIRGLTPCIGLKVYGRQWSVIKNKIPTRSTEQIRSHAQKFFKKARKHNYIVQIKSKRDLKSNRLRHGMPASKTLALTPSGLSSRSKRISKKPSANQNQPAPEDPGDRGEPLVPCESPQPPVKSLFQIKKVIGLHTDPHLFQKESADIPFDEFLNPKPRPPIAKVPVKT